MAATQTDKHRQGRQGKGKPQPKPLKTLVFDSVGPRKYALQVGRARNDNPYIKLVEGVPQDDGSFRRFSINIWSEDFDAFFAMMDELRDYIRDNDIRTPADHKYDPEKAKRRKKGRSRSGN